MNRVRGFTLIEVLLAVSLLTMLASAAISWAVAQRRSGALVEERLERLEQALACRRLIDDDLIQATDPGALIRPAEDGVLHVVTLNRVPGEAAGSHQVEWRYAADQHGLLRVSQGGEGERTRLALPRLRQAWIQQEPSGGLALVVTPEVGDQLRLPLRAGVP